MKSPYKGEESTWEIRHGCSKSDTTEHQQLKYAATKCTLALQQKCIIASQSAPSLHLMGLLSQFGDQRGSLLSFKDYKLVE